MQLETKMALETSAPVLAALVTVGVVDRDGDLIMPNANVHTETAVVSDWDHSFVFQGRAPVGKARIVEVGNTVFAEVEYDTTPDGVKACARVASERPDWSPGFDIIETRPPTSEEKALGARRVIVKWAIKEVSPATKGAGISTGTHHACCTACASGGKCMDETVAEVKSAIATIEDPQVLRKLASHIGSLLKTAPPETAAAPAESKAEAPKTTPAPAAPPSADLAPGYLVEALRERLARLKPNQPAGAAT